MNKDDTMPLHEQLMLLMLRDDTGTLEKHTDMRQLALGGAVLAELILVGAIAIDDDKKKHVRRVREVRLRDSILSESFRLIADAKKTYSAATWVSKLGGIKNLHHRIATELCRRGILEDSEDKVLLFFTRTVYPTINPKPEQKLVGRMREAVLGTDECDSDIVLLIALAHATGLLRIHFDKAELKARKDRLESIVSGGAASQATADAVSAAQQAVQAAIMMSIITSTVITSSS